MDLSELHITHVEPTALDRHPDRSDPRLRDPSELTGDEIERERVSIHQDDGLSSGRECVDEPVRSRLASRMEDLPGFVDRGRLAGPYAFGQDAKDAAGSRVPRDRRLHHEHRVQERHGGPSVDEGAMLEGERRRLLWAGVVPFPSEAPEEPGPLPFRRKAVQRERGVSEPLVQRSRLRLMHSIKDAPGSRRMREGLHALGHGVVRESDRETVGSCRKGLRALRFELLPSFLRDQLGEQRHVMLDLRRDHPIVHEPRSSETMQPLALDTSHEEPDAVKFA